VKKAQVPILLRRSGPPLFRQIADWFRGQVANGELGAGDRLPTIRELAAALAVNRSTVQMAYRALEADGLVESRVGSGTRVASTPAAADGPATRPPAPGVFRPRFSPGAQAAFTSFLSLEGHSHPTGDVIDFSRLVPDERLLPVKAFTSCMNRVLRSHGGTILGYGQHAGNEALRELLAARLSRSGVPTTAGQILITSGAQQGIELAVRAFAAPGEPVIVSSPTYHQVIGLLNGLSLRTLAVPSGADGMDEAALIRALDSGGGRLVYTMPTFHNPTGHTWDVTVRRRFLDLTGVHRCPVVEDDFEQDLRFRGEAVPTLRALCPDGRVLSLGSFSKGLFPGLRLGWVAGSEEVVARIAALKRFSDLSSGSFLQATLVEFMRTGAFDEHLAGIRVLLERRHEAARAAMETHLTRLASWTLPDGGYAIWIAFRPGVDTRALAHLARDRGVLVAPGFLFDPEGSDRSHVRLTVSCVDEEQIPRGIEILAETASELARRRTSSASLFM
jgi:GntR family transcriptional regulator of abcA and norABC